MSQTPQSYNWLDAGAPALLAAAGYNYARNVLRILKACLVTGYGSKPGAGWTLVHEDTTANKERLVLSNGNGVVEVISHGAQSVSIILHESISTQGAGNTHDDRANANTWAVGVNSQSSFDEAYTRDGNGKLLGIRAFLLDSSGPTSPGLVTNTYSWQVIANSKAFYFYGYTDPANTGAGNLATPHWPIFAGAIKTNNVNLQGVGNCFALAGGFFGKNSLGVTTQFDMTAALGLRTPFGATKLPADRFSTTFDLSSRSRLPQRNPDSEMITLMPIYMTFTGAANPDASNRPYIFGALPGALIQEDVTQDLLVLKAKALGQHQYRYQSFTFNGHQTFAFPFRTANTWDSFGRYISLDPALWP
jgi:hypothetical protein